MPTIIEAVVELRRICCLHFVAAILLNSLQKSMEKMYMPLALLSFCNSVCLAERFWEVQRSTMGQWSTAVQICFLVSRAIVSCAVLLIAFVFLCVLYRLP